MFENIVERTVILAGFFAFWMCGYYTGITHKKIILARIEKTKKYTLRR